MAIWYEVKKEKKSMDEFLECNIDFHDFRLERLEYVPGKDIVEMLLRFDNMKEGV